MCWEGDFVRSGMCCGAASSFDTRHTTHAKCALLDKSKDFTRFYCRHPREAAFARAGNTARGVFEGLGRKVGLAFDRDDADTVEALAGPDVFVWTPGVVAKMDTLKLSATVVHSLNAKKMIYASYGVELFHQLCLAPHHDCSVSWGFKGPSGQFGGGGE